MKETDGMERTDRPEDDGGEQGLRVARLAELMVHISECSPAVAISAVTRAAGDTPITNDNALDVLARAMSVARAGIDLREMLDLRPEQVKEVLAAQRR